MIRRLVPALACALLLASCTTEWQTSDAEQEASPAAGPAASTATEPALQPDDLVDLTLYFRAGEGPSAHLQAVTREVAVDQELPRRALELLLAGPTEDQSGLAAPLPSTTQLRELRLEGSTAHVELSPEAVRDAGSVGASPGNELIALAAIANTLTEFPSIERVAVTVHGQGIDQAAFWGGWGMPDVLVRDESLIGPNSDSEGLLDLVHFSADAQMIGSRNAGPVDAVSVRVRDRLAHVRVAVELADVRGGDSTQGIPRTRVRRSGDDIVLEVSRVEAYSADMGTGRRLELSSDAFDAVTVTHEDGALRLRVRVSGAEDRPFWLHGMSSPARVVLDIKK